MEPLAYVFSRRIKDKGYYSYLKDLQLYENLKAQLDFTLKTDTRKLQFIKTKKNCFCCNRDAQGLAGKLNAIHEYNLSSLTRGILASSPAAPWLWKRHSYPGTRQVTVCRVGSNPGQAQQLTQRHSTQSQDRRGDLTQPGSASTIAKILAGNLHYNSVTLDLCFIHQPQKRVFETILSKACEVMHPKMNDQNSVLGLVSFEWKRLNCYNSINTHFFLLCHTYPEVTIL